MHLIYDNKHICIPCTRRRRDFDTLWNITTQEHLDTYYRNLGEEASQRAKTGNWNGW
jgi:hypothetical protein